MPAMFPKVPARTGVTFMDLEFDTSQKVGAPLGDIASSLNSLHDLLRDLGTLAASSSSAEFRDIQVVAIEMGSPLKIRLSLFAISTEAVKAFQEICRDIILSRERPSQQAALTASQWHITETEAQRLQAHVAALQNAEVPLKRVVVVKPE